MVGASEQERDQLDCQRLGRQTISMNILTKIFRRQRRYKPPVKLPVKDYSEARDRAIEQLGDRYLLAEPIRKRPR